MKQCCKCNRTYSDDTLNFCLDDGTLLSSIYDSKATVVIPDPNLQPIKVVHNQGKGRSTTKDPYEWEMAEALLYAQGEFAALAKEQYFQAFLKFLEERHPDEYENFFLNTWRRYETEIIPNIGKTVVMNFGNPDPLPNPLNVLQILGVGISLQNLQRMRIYFKTQKLI